MDNRVPFASQQNQSFQQQPEPVQDHENDMAEAFMDLNRNVMELQDDKAQLEQDSSAKTQEIHFLRSIAKLFDPVMAEWRCQFDNNKQRYYWYNPQTKQSSWESPAMNTNRRGSITPTPFQAELSNSGSPTSNTAQHSMGHQQKQQQVEERKQDPNKMWRRTKDPNTGATYFYNPYSKQTVWTLPEGAELFEEVGLDSSLVSQVKQRLGGREEAERKESYNSNSGGGGFMKDSFSHDAATKIQSLFRMYRFRCPRGVREHRKQVMFELYTSESMFLDSMERLNNIILKPLKASLRNEAEPILQEEDMRRVFGNIDDIYDLSKRFFNALEERLNDWTPRSILTRQLGDIFLNFIPHFSAYRSYFRNFEGSQTRLAQLDTNPDALPPSMDGGKSGVKKTIQHVVDDLKSGSNTRWATFLKTTMEDPELFGLNLPDFLIQPIQRMPRYLLLIKDLAQSTWNGHIDSSPLWESVNQLHVLNEELDSRIHSQEAEELEKAQAWFGKHLTVWMPNREFISSSPIRALLSPSSSSVGGSQALHSVSVFLFNDLVICGQRMQHARGVEDFNYLDHIELAGTQLIKTWGIPSKLQHVKHVLYILRVGRCVALQFHEHEDVEVWRESLDDILEVHKERHAEKESKSQERSTNMSSQEDMLLDPDNQLIVVPANIASKTQKKRLLKKKIVEDEFSFDIESVTGVDDTITFTKTLRDFELLLEQISSSPTIKISTQSLILPQAPQTPRLRTRLFQEHMSFQLAVLLQQLLFSPSFRFSSLWDDFSTTTEI